MGLIDALGLGLVLGLRHALDADHVVAVSTLVAHERRPWQAGWLGVFWGLGHTSTLFLVGIAVTLLGLRVPQAAALGAEFAVGVMLLGLGLLTLHGYARRQVHRHPHSHQGSSHHHLHGHSGSRVHGGQAHQGIDLGHPGPGHRRSRTRLRSYAVGLLHGLAGSAALTVVALAALPGPWLGLLFILVFGAGSVVGMLLVSLTLVVPAAAALRATSGLARHLPGAAGLLSVILGLAIMADLWPALASPLF